MPLDPALPQLVYGGEYVLPDRDSYSFTNPDGARRTDTPGGPMRVELDHIGGPFVVNVTYFADTMARIDFFQRFYLRTTLQGSLPFQCALALESSAVYTDYVVRMKRAPQWNGHTGYQGRVTCVYEVEQRDVDYELEDTLAWLYETYGDDALPTLNALAKLTNPDMDKWIPA